MIARARGLGPPLLAGAFALAACDSAGPAASSPGASGAPVAATQPPGSATTSSSTSGAGTADTSAPGTAGTTSGAAASAPVASQCPDGRALVPARTFRMGSPADDRDADPDERPVREVRLGTYCIDRTEVTVASYARCVAEPRSGATCTAASAVVVSRGLAPTDVLFWSKFCNAGQKDRGDHPVNCVDWKQADGYCKWAGGRLPTEAEWEYAARGADGRKYPWGNDAPSAARLNACGSECSASAAALGRKDKKTMFEGDDGAAGTAPVARYPEGASPFGALDMAGNVWEWTADAYAPYDPLQTDNPVAPGGPARVVRGGHWLNAGPQSPRSANRESKDQEKRLEDVGFRCVSEPVR